MLYTHTRAHTHTHKHTPATSRAPHIRLCVPTRLVAKRSSIVSSLAAENELKSLAA